MATAGAASISSRTSDSGSSTVSSPFLPQLERKMSANDGAMMARKPRPPSAQAACSRDEPQPKFAPATRIGARSNSGRLSGKSSSLAQSQNRNCP